MRTHIRLEALINVQQLAQAVYDVAAPCDGLAAPVAWLLRHLLHNAFTFAFHHPPVLQRLLPIRPNRRNHLCSASRR